MKPLIYTVLFCFLIATAQGEEASCLQNAQTQFEMNQCSGLNLSEAQKELKRVLTEIRKAYKSTSPKMLKKLDISQSMWEKSVEADIEFKFPEENKQEQYGSVYSMCANGFRTFLVLKRVEFLKTWLKGHKGDEVCSGSIIHEYCLKNDCSQINK